MTGAPLLEVRRLRTEIASYSGIFPVVNDVSFSVAPGSFVALVGESGSGKTMTAHSIMRIQPDPPARIAAGEVWFEGRDLMALSEDQMRSVRGNRIAMIFQEPMTSLNPLLTVGEQIAEAVLEHRAIGKKAAWAEALQLLRQVRIADPEARLRDYPHRLSGGMRQRVMIAMALACRPQLLIADEPTTALDVTIQYQILRLLKALQAEMGLAILLITHSLGVVAEFADRVLVMYGGRVVEEATTDALFTRPLHPYAQALLAAVPSFSDTVPLERSPLAEIGGVVPSLSALPPGCAFHPRCGQAMARCRTEQPALLSFAEDRRAACFAVEQAMADA